MKNSSSTVPKFRFQQTPLVTRKLHWRYLHILEYKDSLLRDQMNISFSRTKHSSFGKLDQPTASITAPCLLTLDGQFTVLRTSSSLETTSIRIYALVRSNILVISKMKTVFSSVSLRVRIFWDILDMISRNSMIVLTMSSKASWKNYHLINAKELLVLTVTPLNISSLWWTRSSAIR